MQVQILRVSSMPCDTVLLVMDLPDRFVIYVDEGLTAEETTRVIEHALNENVQHWRRSSARGKSRPRLRAHTG